jgi:hypothetical protein
MHMHHMFHSIILEARVALDFIASLDLCISLHSSLFGADITRFSEL